MGLFSRGGLPDGLRSTVSVPAGERVQAWAPCADAPDDAVVATDLALYLPRAEGYERVPWDLVQRASWDSGVLDLRTRPEPGAKLRRSVIRLDDVRDLPEVVQGPGHGQRGGPAAPRPGRPAAVWWWRPGGFRARTSCAGPCGSIPAPTAPTRS